MNLKSILLYLLIIVLYCTCTTNKHVVKIKSAPTFSQTWVNKTKYEELQDYVKNLDFSLLDDPETHPSLKELLAIIKRIIHGEGLAVISTIEQAINSNENKTLQKIYLGFVRELLFDAGKYQAIVENLPDSGDKLALAYSKMPQEKYTQASHSIQTPLLEKVDIGYFTLAMKANDFPIEAYFDTGSDISHLSMSYAKKLGLSYDPNEAISVHTSNTQNVVGYPAYIDELVIGDVVIKNHPVLIFEDETLTINSNQYSFKLDFTLGWSLIRNLRFQLDFINHRYEATLPEPSNQKNKNLFWCGYPGVKVNSIDGQSLIFGLDTGAKKTELRYNCLEKMKLQKVKEEWLDVGGLGGIERIKAKTAKDVSLFFANHRFDFKSMDIFDDSDLYFISQDGTIGADIFKEKVIVLDYANGIFSMED